METPLDLILFILVYLVPVLMWASALVWAFFAKPITSDPMVKTTPSCDVEGPGFTKNHTTNEDTPRVTGVNAILR